MPREFVLGNGRLAVAVDRDMCIRDFYYPHVGLENHVIGHKFLTGVWIDGSFSWIGLEWEIAMELSITGYPAARALRR